MKIHSESRIHHPVEAVYLAYRDRLPEIARYIPDIKEIRVESREDTDDGCRLHNLWISDKELPAVVRGVVKPEMMRWDDYAEWHDSERYVAWRLVIPTFKDQVRCEGRNTFHVDGAGARVVLTGNLEIKLERVPGVPAFMARRVAPMIEEFIVKLITPNLERVNQSLETYLDADA